MAVLDATYCDVQTGRQEVNTLIDYSVDLIFQKKQKEFCLKGFINPENKFYWIDGVKQSELVKGTVKTFSFVINENKFRHAIEVAELADLKYESNKNLLVVQSKKELFTIDLGTIQKECNEQKEIRN